MNKCSMSRKIESLRKRGGSSRIKEHYVQHVEVSTDWQYDKEIAADVVEEVGFGTFSRECNIDTAESWEECIKTKNVSELAKKIQEHIDAGWWDGYVASTGSLSTEEFARLVIYLYYNKCDQTCGSSSDNADYES